MTKATIDREGRIALAEEIQKQLGVEPGDDVVLEPRGQELLVTAAKGETGFCYEGNVLVHRGTCRRDGDALSAEREERMEHLSQGLPQ